MLDGKTDRGGEQGGTNGLKGKHKVFKSHKYSNGINNDGKVVLENFCKAEASETTGEKGRPEEVDRTGEEVLLLGTTKTHTQREREREGRAGTGDLWFHRYQMERTLRRHLPGHCHVVDVGSAGRCTRQDRIPVPQRYAQLNAFP